MSYEVFRTDQIGDIALMSRYLKDSDQYAALLQSIGVAEESAEEPKTVVETQ
jgi:hypothetical protein